MMNKAKNYLVIFFSVVLTTLFSGFIYMHIYEKLAFKDIPYISSVQKTQAPKVIWQIKENENILLKDNQKYGLFGKPKAVIFPRLNHNLNLLESYKENNNWVSDGVLGNVYFFAPGNSGRMGQAVIFAAQKSASLSIVQLAVEGDRIIVDTDLNWRYHFRISRKSLASKDNPYLASATYSPKIIVISPSSENERYFLLECDFLALEEKIS
jgi:hypothetical protein